MESNGALADCSNEVCMANALKSNSTDNSLGPWWISLKGRLRDRKFSKFDFIFLICVRATIVALFITWMVGGVQSSQSQINQARANYQTAYSKLQLARGALHTQWKSSSSHAKKLYPFVQADGQFNTKVDAQKSYNAWINGLNKTNDFLVKKVNSDSGYYVNTIQKRTKSVQSMTAQAKIYSSEIPSLEEKAVADHRTASEEEMDQLRNEIKTATDLVNSSNNQVEDEATRTTLSDTCNRRSELIGDSKKGDTLTYLASLKAIESAEQKVRDSQDAKKRADVQRAADEKRIEEAKKAQEEEAARQAEQARQEAQERAEEQRKVQRAQQAQQAQQQRSSQRRQNAGRSQGYSRRNTSRRNSGGNSSRGSGVGDGGVYYKNCSAVRAAGKAPLYRGQPGYASHLDRDHDGIACE